MSQENAEIVRRFYEAWLRNDPSAFEVLDSEIVLYPASENDWVGLEAVYTGHDGVRRYMQLIAEALDDYHPEIVELIDAGDQVLTLAVESGRGKTSGAAGESHTAHVWTLRNGKMV